MKLKNRKRHHRGKIKTYGAHERKELLLFMSKNQKYSYDDVKKATEYIKDNVTPSEVINHFTPNMIIKGKRTNYCYLCGKKSLLFNDVNGVITCMNTNCQLNKSTDVIGYVALIQNLDLHTQEGLFETCSLLVQRFNLPNSCLPNYVSIADALRYRIYLRIFMSLNEWKYADIIDYFKLNDVYTADYITTCIRYHPFSKSTKSIKKQKIGKESFREFYQYLIDEHMDDMNKIEHLITNDINGLIDRVIDEVKT